MFAGPNGSGKSTFAQFLKPKCDFINADEIKKNLLCSDSEAAQIAERQREEHIAELKDFSFETVLSPDRNLKLLERAKKESYFIRCYYILTVSPQNMRRIKSRVETGGHDVPADKVIKRYDRALNLVKDMIKICDICRIYDNSKAVPWRIFKKRKNLFLYEANDLWNCNDIRGLTGIGNISPKDLNI